MWNKEPEEQNRGRQNQKWEMQREKVREALFLLILAVYPMRHIHWGLDLWDTGYNYANFAYMGLEHMDPMWLYSTYLANAVGHLMTMLPFGKTLMGMNFYTGLLTSVLAIAGYLFCTRRIKIPSWIAFAGEVAAVSFCWCPTALLYNYLTYLLFLACVILLYEGLCREKRLLLFVAGICLGTNVLVRFSNLPEAALIVAVWAYGVVEKAKLSKTVRRTAWCLGGYLTALFFLFGYIHIRYGMDSYVEGIGRLFAMTDNATDYKATSMIINLIHVYVTNLYWVIRILIIAAAGTVLFGVTEALCAFWKKKQGKEVPRAVGVILRGLWCGVSAVMLVWLYVRGFCSTEYYDYGSMLRPGILFLMLTMGIGVIRIFHKSASKEEKLLSGILILVVLLTSIGSNNHVFASLNNLFLAAPYTLWECYRFVRYAGDRMWKKIPLCAFPAKGVLTAFLGMVLIQSFLFGACFVFVEAKGAREVTAKVENNEVLKGMRMSPERAEWMTQLSGYVEEQGLKGKEVILYGQIPSLSYYLQMPSAFNPWSDLASYSFSAMEADMEEVCERMQEEDSYRPVVILENAYAVYLEGEEEAESKNPKWQLLVEFLEKQGYEQTFRNEKFGVWE